jgi:hypothetical protein
MSRKKLTKKEIEIRAKAECYDRVCQTLGIKKDILGYIENIRHPEEKELFHDNRWLRTPSGMRGEYFGLKITTRCIWFYRYTVPGRCDSYCFKWGNSSIDDISRLSYYSEFDIPMSKSINQLKKDLRKKQIKQLISKASENDFYKRRIAGILNLI